MGGGRLPAGAEPLTGRLVGAGMFLFFSNRTGCLGSLLITAVGTLLLLVLLGWVQL